VSAGLLERKEVVEDRWRRHMDAAGPLIDLIDGPLDEATGERQPTPVRDRAAGVALFKP
jgi:hypothetical protein